MSRESRIAADNPARPFRGYLHQLAELKRTHPRLKLLISLEGRASDFAFDAQPEHRQAFLDSCVNLFLKGNLAPGIREPGPVRWHRHRLGVPAR